jgi:hypothetical protein
MAVSPFSEVTYKVDLHLRYQHALIDMYLMDIVEGACVDPGETGAILEAGGVGGTRPARRGKRRTVEEDRRYKMPQKSGDGLATTPSHVYALSMYHCALCIPPTPITITGITFSLYYLFQENKSFGSKKPFASILWCTRSCVKHNVLQLKIVTAGVDTFNIFDVAIVKGTVIAL